MSIRRSNSSLGQVGGSSGPHSGNRVSSDADRKLIAQSFTQVESSSAEERESRSKNHLTTSQEVALPVLDWVDEMALPDAFVGRSDSEDDSTSSSSVSSDDRFTEQFKSSTEESLKKNNLVKVNNLFKSAVTKKFEDKRYLRQNLEILDRMTSHLFSDETSADTAAQLEDNFDYLLPKGAVTSELTEERIAQKAKKEFSAFELKFSVYMMVTSRTLGILRSALGPEKARDYQRSLCVKLGNFVKSISDPKTQANVKEVLAKKLSGSWPGYVSNSAGSGIEGVKARAKEKMTLLLTFEACCSPDFRGERVADVANDSTMRASALAIKNESASAAVSRIEVDPSSPHHDTSALDAQRRSSRDAYLAEDGYHNDPLADTFPPLSRLNTDNYQEIIDLLRSSLPKQQDDVSESESDRVDESELRKREEEIEKEKAQLEESRRRKEEEVHRQIKEVERGLPGGKKLSVEQRQRLQDLFSRDEVDTGTVRDTIRDLENAVKEQIRKEELEALKQKEIEQKKRQELKRKTEAIKCRKEAVDNAVATVLEQLQTGDNLALDLSKSSLELAEIILDQLHKDWGDVSSEELEQLKTFISDSIRDPLAKAKKQAKIQKLSSDVSEDIKLKFLEALKTVPLEDTASMDAVYQQIAALIGGDFSDEELQEVVATLKKNPELTAARQASIDAKVAKERSDQMSVLDNLQPQSLRSTDSPSSEITINGQAISLRPDLSLDENLQLLNAQLKEAFSRLTEQELGDLLASNVAIRDAIQMAREDHELSRFQNCAVARIGDNAVQILGQEFAITNPISIQSSQSELSKAIIARSESLGIPKDVELTEEDLKECLSKNNDLVPILETLNQVAKSQKYIRETELHPVPKVSSEAAMLSIDIGGRRHELSSKNGGLYNQVTALFRDTLRDQGFADLGDKEIKQALPSDLKDAIRQVREAHLCLQPWADSTQVTASSSGLVLILSKGEQVHTVDCTEMKRAGLEALKQFFAKQLMHLEGQWGTPKNPLITEDLVLESILKNDSITQRLEYLLNKERVLAEMKDAGLYSMDRHQPNESIHYALLYGSPDDFEGNQVSEDRSYIKLDKLSALMEERGVQGLRTAMARLYMRAINEKAGDVTPVFADPLDQVQKMLAKQRTERILEERATSEALIAGLKEADIAVPDQQPQTEELAIALSLSENHSFESELLEMSLQSWELESGIGTITANGVDLNCDRDTDKQAVLEAIRDQWIRLNRNGQYSDSEYHSSRDLFPLVKELWQEWKMEQTDHSQSVLRIRPEIPSLSEVLADIRSNMDSVNRLLTQKWQAQLGQIPRYTDPQGREITIQSVLENCSETELRSAKFTEHVDKKMAETAIIARVLGGRLDDVINEAKAKHELLELKRAIFDFGTDENHVVNTVSWKGHSFAVPEGVPLDSPMFCRAFAVHINANRESYGISAAFENNDPAQQTSFSDPNSALAQLFGDFANSGGDAVSEAFRSEMSSGRVNDDTNSQDIAEITKVLEGNQSLKMQQYCVYAREKTRYLLNLESTRLLTNTEPREPMWPDRKGPVLLWGEKQEVVECDRGDKDAAKKGVILQYKVGDLQRSCFIDHEGQIFFEPGASIPQVAKAVAQVVKSHASKVNRLCQELAFSFQEALSEGAGFSRAILYRFPSKFDDVVLESDDHKQIQVFATVSGKKTLLFHLDPKTFDIVWDCQVPELESVMPMIQEHLAPLKDTIIALRKIGLELFEFNKTSPENQLRIRDLVDCEDHQFLEYVDAHEDKSQEKTLRSIMTHPQFSEDSSHILHIKERAKITRAMLRRAESKRAGNLIKNSFRSSSWQIDNEDPDLIVINGQTLSMSEFASLGEGYTEIPPVVLALQAAIPGLSRRSLNNSAIRNSISHLFTLKKVEKLAFVGGGSLSDFSLEPNTDLNIPARALDSMGAFLQSLGLNGMNKQSILYRSFQEVYRAKHDNYIAWKKDLISKMDVSGSYEDSVPESLRTVVSEALFNCIRSFSGERFPLAVRCIDGKTAFMALAGQPVEGEGIEAVITNGFGLSQEEFADMTEVLGAEKLATIRDDYSVLATIREFQNSLQVTITGGETYLSKEPNFTLDEAIHNPEEALSRCLHSLTGREDLNPDLYSGTLEYLSYSLPRFRIDQLAQCERQRQSLLHRMEMYFPDTGTTTTLSGLDVGWSDFWRSPGQSLADFMNGVHSQPIACVESDFFLDPATQVLEDSVIKSLNMEMRQMVTQAGGIDLFLQYETDAEELRERVEFLYRAPSREKNARGVPIDKQLLLEIDSDKRDLGSLIRYKEGKMFEKIKNETGKGYRTEEKEAFLHYDATVEVLHAEYLAREARFLSAFENSIQITSSGNARTMLGEVSLEELLESIPEGNKYNGIRQKLENLRDGYYASIEEMDQSLLGPYGDKMRERPEKETTLQVLLTELSRDVTGDNLPRNLDRIAETLCLMRRDVKSVKKDEYWKGYAVSVLTSPEKLAELLSHSKQAYLSNISQKSLYRLFADPELRESIGLSEDEVMAEINTRFQVSVEKAVVITAGYKAISGFGLGSTSSPMTFGKISVTGGKSKPKLRYEPKEKRQHKSKSSMFRAQGGNVYKLGGHNDTRMLSILDSDRYKSKKSDKDRQASSDFSKLGESTKQMIRRRFEEETHGKTQVSQEFMVFLSAFGFTMDAIGAVGDDMTRILECETEVGEQLLDDFLKHVEPVMCVLGTIDNYSHKDSSKQRSVVQIQSDPKHGISRLDESKRPRVVQDVKLWMLELVSNLLNVVSYCLFRGKDSVTVDYQPVGEKVSKREIQLSYYLDAIESFLNVSVEDDSISPYDRLTLLQDRCDGLRKTVTLSDDGDVLNKDEIFSRKEGKLSGKFRESKGVAAIAKTAKGIEKAVQTWTLKLSPKKPHGPSSRKRRSTKPKRDH